MPDNNANKKLENIEKLQATVFRRLVSHLRTHSDVQNIDLMNLAGFCRNCLGNWLMDAASAEGAALSKNESRELIYGMPYEDWKAKYQLEVSQTQKDMFSAKPIVQS